VDFLLASDREMPHFNAVAVGDPPANIAINDMSLKLDSSGYCRRKYRCMFNHFYVMRPRMLPNSAE